MVMFFRPLLWDRTIANLFFIFFLSLLKDRTIANVASSFPFLYLRQYRHFFIFFRSLLKDMTIANLFWPFLPFP